MHYPTPPTNPDGVRAGTHNRKACWRIRLLPRPWQRRRVKQVIILLLVPVAVAAGVNAVFDERYAAVAGSVFALFWWTTMNKAVALDDDADQIRRDAVRALRRIVAGYPFTDAELRAAGHAVTVAGEMFLDLGDEAAVFETALVGGDDVREHAALLIGVLLVL